MSTDGRHSDAALGGVWDLPHHQPLPPQPDIHGHTPRTEQLSHEVAVVQHIPVDAQNLGLTDLTAPGLAMATSLNSERRRHRLVAKLFLAFLLIPLAFSLVGLVVNLLG
ncbi:hypothetical protein AAEX63_06030 [Luteococcus sp. H138]|uniref:hypothetical protein n=1 Tax=unclassified Luteococcus TaxID=2639923 RepID=UPI00313BF7B3